MHYRYCLSSPIQAIVLSRSGGFTNHIEADTRMIFCVEKGPAAEATDTPQP
jgi:hypothetical protein